MNLLIFLWEERDGERKRHDMILEMKCELNSENQLNKLILCLRECSYRIVFIISDSSSMDCYIIVDVM